MTKPLVTESLANSLVDADQVASARRAAFSDPTNITSADFPVLPGITHFPSRSEFPQPGGRLPGDRPFPPLDWERMRGPVDPPLRNEQVRRAEVASTWPDFLESIRIAEQIETFDQAWAQVLTAFDGAYDRYIALPLTPPASQPPASAHFFPPGALIARLDLPFHLTGLKEDLAFTALPEDALLDEFNVQRLCEDAGSLLDRCSGLEAAREERATQAANLACELATFLKADRIYREAVVAGLYSNELARVVRAWDAEKQRQAATQSRRDAALLLLGTELSDKGRANRVHAASIAAYAAPLRVYENSDPGSLVQQPVDGVTMSVPEHLKEAAISQQTALLNSQFAEVNGSGRSENANSQASDHTLSALREQVEWTFANISFAKAQHLATIDVVMAKMKAASEPEGTLNFPWQERLAAQRLKREFRDAGARMIAIVQGLNKIYSSSPVMPPLIQAHLGLIPKPTPAPPGDILTEATNWVRSVMHFLIANRSREQQTVIALSLRTALGAAEWRKFSGGDAVVLMVGSGHIQPYTQARLLGVGASITVAGDFSRNTLIAGAPEEGVFPGQPNDRLVDQTPRALIRVAGLSGLNCDLQYFGMSQVLNRSPRGAWSLQLLDPPTVLKGTGDLILRLAMVAS